jgi:hypothetical protein
MIQQRGDGRDVSEKIVQWEREFFLLKKVGSSRDVFFGGPSPGREDLDPITAIIRSYLEAERSGQALSRDVSATDTPVHTGRTLVKRIHAIVA